MSEPLSPIPTPPALLWRQLRLQYLPVVVFVAGVAAAAVIWTRWVAPPTLVAEVETIRSDVRSTHAGTLSNVTVKFLQPVRAGQVVGEVVITDSRVMEASLAVLRAEVDAIRFTMDPVVGQQRAVLDYERLLLDLMKARVDLVALQAQLIQAQSTFTRTSALYAAQLATDERFEETKNARDSFEAQVKAQNALVQRIDSGLHNFTAEGTNGQLSSPVQGLRAAIKVQEEKLRLAEAQLSPIPLIAPIDGVVTLVHRQPGETVAAGESIFQVSATHSDQLIGFLRQPLSLHLKPGTTVEVRTRTLQRQTASATITHVGQLLEPISPTLLAAMRLPVSNVPTEFGVRVVVAAPRGLSLRPGEQVDLIVQE
jgi:multidrug resistance efflux pump